MDSTYRIVLADGQEIKNLRMNGNNFVSETPIDKSIFEGNLSTVTIYENNVPEVHEHMALVQLIQMFGQYWFILRDMTQKELDEIQLRADVDFIAMMSDIEL